MGWQDRDYGNGDMHRRMVRPKMPTTLTGWVMGLVVVGFFISVGSKTAAEYGLLAAGSVVPGAQVWRLLTYPWISYGFGGAVDLVLSLLFYLMLIWTFGRLAESLLTRAQWLLVAVLGPLAGALVLEGVWHFFPSVLASDIAAGPMVIMYALMGAAVARAPRMGMGLMFLPITIELRWVAAFITGISLLLVLSHSPSGADEMAHLVSFGVGAALAKTGKIRGGPFAALRVKIHNWRYHRHVRSFEEHRAEVDRILAKIKQEGMGKLTRQEKETLKRDTARLKG